MINYLQNIYNYIFKANKQSVNTTYSTVCMFNKTVLVAEYIYIYVNPS